MPGYNCSLHLAISYEELSVKDDMLKAIEIANEAGGQTNSDISAEAVS